MRLTTITLLFAASAGAPALAASSDPIQPEAYFKSADGDDFDDLGRAVAIDGDTLVVGVPWEDSGVAGDPSDDSTSAAGAVYVYLRDNGAWSQQAYLKASNPGNADEFGHAVAIDGDTIVVGAPFEDSHATGVNGSGASDFFSNSGAAYVFVRSGTTWTQEAYLKASNTDPQDRFGGSVSISGDTIAIGAYEEDGASPGVNGDDSSDALSSSGAAYVFTRSGTTWSQEAYVKPLVPGGSDFFGDAVAIDGDTLLVSATAEDSSSAGVGGDPNDDGTTDAGALYVFDRVGTTWSQSAFVKASNPMEQAYFGFSIDLDGDTAVVGAFGEKSASTGVDGTQTDDGVVIAGSAYVLVRNAGVWSQEAYLKATNTAQGDRFGWSVALSGDRALVGAWSEDSVATGLDGDDTDDTAADAGATYAFTRNAGAWSPAGYLKAPNTDQGDRFGIAVAGSGETFVVGAPSEDSIATGIDGDQDDDTGFDRGAVFTFDMNAGALNEPYCTGDGTGGACPCGATGAPGAGCATTTTSGATLVATGDALFAADTFGLQITGIPAGKPGLAVKGMTTLNGGLGNPVGDGLLCTSPQLRSQVIIADGSGTVTMTDWRGQPFGSFPNAAGVGEPSCYQWWFRDPMNGCSGQGLNFSNAWIVEWQ